MIRGQATKRRAQLAAIALCFGSAGIAADDVTLHELHASLDDGRYDIAEQQASHYLQLHPGNRDARFLHALALAGQGKREAAISAFKSLTDDYPDRVEPANNLAVLYARDKQFNKARQWLETAMATQPAYATAHRNLGDTYTALADLAYRRALDSDDPASKESLHMIDRFYYERESVAADGSCSFAQIQPADQPGPVPSASQRSSVMQTVRAWAQAWARQDIDAYLAFYAEDFDPGNSLSRRQWRTMRKARLSAPDDIHITVEDPALTDGGDRRLQVEFKQTYRSPGYSDVVTKRLLLQRNDDSWRILRETSITNT